jgi:DNA-binding NarL/FixJ family response regulator
MIRVLIADDQHLVRAGLAALLGAETDIEVAGVARDGTEALATARDLVPDVACLDIRMPGRSGIEVAQELCALDADPQVPVLVLTTFDLDDYVFGALEAGASGFLLKDAPPETIVHAVRQVAAGQGTIDQTLTRRILREFVHRRRLQPVTGRRPEDLLTPREHEILLLLAPRRTPPCSSPPTSCAGSLGTAPISWPRCASASETLASRFVSPISSRSPCCCWTSSNASRAGCPWTRSCARSAGHETA